MFVQSYKIRNSDQASDKRQGKNSVVEASKSTTEFHPETHSHKNNPRHTFETSQPHGRPSLSPEKEKNGKHLHRSPQSSNSSLSRHESLRCKKTDSSREFYQSPAKTVSLFYKKFYNTYHHNQFVHQFIPYDKDVKNKFFRYKTLVNNIIAFATDANEI